MEPRKRVILDALSAFMNQRPGLEPGNYIDMYRPDPEGRKAYFAEARSITKDLHHARTLMRAVELSDSITADDLLKAAPRAYSGRLTITEESGPMQNAGYYGISGEAALWRRAKIDYCTGQYFPTEYRRAVCAVLASALWEHVREHCMPGMLQSESTSGKVSAGDWLRAHFRQQFGRGIASRWFS